MTDEKSEKFSISFPGWLLKAMDAHTGKGKRSAYLQHLAEDNLRKEGVLNEDPIAEELRRTRELIEVRGLDAVKAKHDELATEMVVAVSTAEGR